MRGAFCAAPDRSPLDPICARALLLWRQNASRLEAVSTSPVLVHSDFKVANVKWSPAEECAVVFDWEFAWAGPNLFDLGQMFRWNPPEPFVRGFEAAYRSRGGTLSDNLRRDAELYDLLSLVDFLHRDRSDEIRDRDVRTRIVQTLERHPPVAPRRTLLAPNRRFGSAENHGHAKSGKSGPRFGALTTRCSGRPSSAFPSPNGLDSRCSVVQMRTADGRR